MARVSSSIPFYCCSLISPSSTFSSRCVCEWGRWICQSANTDLLPCSFSPLLSSFFSLGCSLITSSFSYFFFHLLLFNEGELGRKIEKSAFLGILFLYHTISCFSLYLYLSHLPSLLHAPIILSLSLSSAFLSLHHYFLLFLSAPVTD